MLGKNFRRTSNSLVGNGEKVLFVVGGGEVLMCIAKNSLLYLLLSLKMINLILADEVLGAEKFVTDYGENHLKSYGLELGLQHLLSEFVAISKYVIGIPLCIKAELIGIHCGLSLFG